MEPMALFWGIVLLCVLLYYTKKYLIPRLPLETIFPYLYILNIALLLADIATH